MSSRFQHSNGVIRERALGGLGVRLRATGDPNTLACLCESTERRLSASCTLDDGFRDAFSDFVRFAARCLSTNPIERDLHIGQRPAIEASVNHANLPVR